MSALRLVILVLVAGATGCFGFTDQLLTRNPPTPDYVLLGNRLAAAIKEDIENKLAPIRSSIAELKSIMQETCTPSLVDIGADMSGSMAIDHTQQLVEIERKVNVAIQKTEALEGKLQEKFEGLATSEQIEGLATSGQIADLDYNIATKIREANEGVTAQGFTKEQMEDAVREEVTELKRRCTSEQRLTALQNNVLEVKEKLEQVMNENVEINNKVGQIGDLNDSLSTQIREASESMRGGHFTKEEMEDAVREEVAELKKRCTSEERLTALQSNVLEVKEQLEEVMNENAEIKDKVEQYADQKMSEDMTDVKNFVEVMVKEVERLAMDTRNFSHTLEEVSYSVQQLTATPPPPPEEEQEEYDPEALGPVYPCVDSIFTGTDSLKVCQMAARFNKCRLPLVSYHCCHTCTSLGLIPEMGAWRHLNLTRHVKSFQVINVFAP